MGFPNIFRYEHPEIETFTDFLIKNPKKLSKKFQKNFFRIFGINPKRKLDGNPECQDWDFRESGIPKISGFGFSGFRIPELQEPIEEKNDKGCPPSKFVSTNYGSRLYFAPCKALLEVAMVHNSLWFLP